jgi:hypothetical protein
VFGIMTEMVQPVVGKGKSREEERNINKRDT